MQSHESCVTHHCHKEGCLLIVMSSPSRTFPLQTSKTKTGHSSAFFSRLYPTKDFIRFSLKSKIAKILILCVTLNGFHLELKETRQNKTKRNIENKIYATYIKMTDCYILLFPSLKVRKEFCRFAKKTTTNKQRDKCSFLSCLKA